MIQRPQTLLLLIAALLHGLSLWAPFWIYGAAEGTYERVFGAFVTANEVANASFTTFAWARPDQPGLAFHAAFILASLAAVAGLIASIFGYQNRARQIQTILWLLLLQCGALLSMVFLTMRAPAYLMGSEGQGAPEWGFALPVAAILLAWAATRLIRKDENLVRSADRLR